MVLPKTRGLHFDADADADADADGQVCRRLP
jgi:hypothetical protein